MKFRAKAIMSIEELNANEIKHENGWVTGWLLGDLIVGAVEDIEAGWICPSFWTKVDLDTVEQLGNDIELQKAFDEISEAHSLHLKTVTELQRIAVMVSGKDYENKRIGVALVELEGKFHNHMKKWAEKEWV